MNSIELRADVIDVLAAGLAPMIVGSPGIGKSDIIRDIGEQFKLKVIDLRLSQCDPTDLLGFPIHDGKRMTYAPPMHFPLETDDLPKGMNGWLLFLDEISSASLTNQAAAYKLVLDRMVGQENLHKKCAIVCAGNKSTDNAVVNRMSTAMQSRMVHLELTVDVQAWVAWASGKGIDHRCISYIEGCPDNLHQFDPNHNDSTFACPRTWEFTSKLIKGKDALAQRPDGTPRYLERLIGTLSAGVAHEFHAYLQYCADLPSIKEIEARPDDIEIPTEPALLFATSHMVAAYMDEAKADRHMRYLTRLPLEFAVTAVRSALKRKKGLLKIPAIRDWAHKMSAEIFA